MFWLKWELFEATQLAVVLEFIRVEGYGLLDDEVIKTAFKK